MKCEKPLKLTLDVYIMAWPTTSSIHFSIQMYCLIYSDIILKAIFKTQVFYFLNRHKRSYSEFKANKSQKFTLEIFSANSMAKNYKMIFGILDRIIFVMYKNILILLKQRKFFYTQ